MNKIQKLAFAAAISLATTIAISCSSDSNDGDEGTASSSSSTEKAPSSSSEQSSSSAQQSSSSSNGGGSSSSIAASGTIIAGLQESLYKNAQVYLEGANFTKNADVLIRIDDIYKDNNGICTRHDDGEEVDCEAGWFLIPGYVSAGQIVNGKLSLNLPASIDNKYLRSLDDGVFSDEHPVFTIVYDDDKECFIELGSGIGDEGVSFMYFSKAFSFVDLNFPKGWSALYASDYDEHEDEWKLSSSYDGEGTLKWTIDCEN